jgi:hypothetical protein
MVILLYNQIHLYKNKETSQSDCQLDVVHNLPRKLPPKIVEWKVDCVLCLDWLTTWRSSKCHKNGTIGIFELIPKPYQHSKFLIVTLIDTIFWVYSKNMYQCGYMWLDNTHVSHFGRVHLGCQRCDIRKFGVYTDSMNVSSSFSWTSNCFIRKLFSHALTAQDMESP